MTTRMIARNKKTNFPKFPRKEMIRRANTASVVALMKTPSRTNTQADRKTINTSQHRTHTKQTHHRSNSSSNSSNKIIMIMRIQAMISILPLIMETLMLPLELELHTWEYR